MWYNLPRTDLDPDRKRDQQLLQMRHVLDPHRHYKKGTGKTADFSQVGTIVEGPTDFYSSRLTNKERHETFADEILATEKQSGKLKRTYDEIKAASQSGKKSRNKSTMKKRRKKR